MTRRPSRRRPGFRTPRFESVEPRLVMSSHPAIDITPQAMIQPPAAGLYSTLAVTDDFTGLASARQEFGLTGKGQTVVVIDSGIAYDHPALGGGFGPGYRVVGGFDFTEERDGNPYDDGPSGSHGTHVAGIIASSDPEHLGIAPGVDLVALRVLNDAGQTTFERVEEALRWVHENRTSFRSPITTVNLSLGQQFNGEQPPAGATLEDELAQLKADGIFISVAAGNSYGNYNQPGLTYPAASSFVVPVSSVDPDGNLSYFSQRSERAIAAPGRGVASTVPDYAGNRNGVADDYARYSGTSMASPLVAGASALLRQAYAMAGVPNVTEDTLYQLMRNTADVIRDAATGQNVYRLNVRRALDAIIPADEYGSTAGEAYGLGSVTDTLSTGGMVGRLSDRDYFAFTAGRTGRITLSAAVSDEMRAAWELVGLGPIAPAADGTVGLDVVAGRTYIVGLGTQGGLGRYALNISLVAASVPDAAPAAGPIGEGSYRDQQITSDGRTLAVTASQSGWLTIDAAFNHALGDVDLEVYDANNNLVAGSYGVGNSERVDLVAAPGQVFYVQVWLNGAGVNPDVDLRVTNLVSWQGNTVTVLGTDGDDTFALDAGAVHRLTINGVPYSFDGSQFTIVSFDGLAGRDTARLTGTAAADEAVVQVGSARLVGPGYQVQASNAEEVTVVGGGGVDIASLYDSRGDDTFRATPEESTLRGSGYAHRTLGFETVHAYATSGGTDVAYLYDSPGNDLFIATPTYGKLYGEGFFRRAKLFDAVHAYASAGYDAARLTGSSGNDTFVGAPDYSQMSGPRYFDRANGFDETIAWGVAGGYDRAFLYGSGAGDSLTGDSRHAVLQGPGFASDARRFNAIYAEREGSQLAAMSAVDYVMAMLSSSPPPRCH